jgi:hypothetical protein
VPRCIFQLQDALLALFLETLIWNIKLYMNFFKYACFVCYLFFSSLWQFKG